MSLIEHERRGRRKAAKRQQRQKQQKRRQRQPLSLPTTPLHDNQVLDFGQWCALNAISLRTGRRLLASGAGPKVVQLSPARIGITIRANREWQQSRERA